MKKLWLSLLLIGMTFVVRGQAYNNNTFFWSLNAGTVNYRNSGTSVWSVPSAGLYAGRWLMKPLAFRVAADFMLTPSYRATRRGETEGSPFIMGSAEFMWDINATFFHVSNKRILTPIPVYPLIGLGVVFVPATEDQEHQGLGIENDFQTMLGCHLPLQIGKKWDLFLEYKCFFLPQKFDGGNYDNFMHTFTLGLTHRAWTVPYHRHTDFESHSTDEDWFAGFGAGVSFSSFEFAEIWNSKAKLWNFSPEIMVGRNYSNVWTIRFELSGFFARERYIEGKGPGGWYTFNNLHSDFMINLTHLFNFRRGVKWNFLPYLGAGPVWRYLSHPTFNVAADGGLFIRRFVDNMSDFYIDLKYIMVPPRIAGGMAPGGSIIGVGYPIATIGYIYNFGRSTTRYRMPVNNCSDNRIRY